MAGLEARGLCFGYSRGAMLIEDWGHVFLPGTMTALTGVSGRGKSTLMYLLGLMLAPVSGSVFVDGVDTGLLSDGERSRLRAKRFGFVFQDAVLDGSRSVLDNVTEVALYRGVDRRCLESVARGLLARFDVDVAVDCRPGQVSGGQAGRIALCRALVGDPDFLLADEPTGNLDVESAACVVAGLRSYACAGGTVVIVTHSSVLADACDVVVAL